MIQRFFTEKEKADIKQSIINAEHQTSGEIRVHIDRKCKVDVMDRAAYIFKKLEMHKTALRNGVLFYLSIKDKKFAILGDAGINNVTPDDFWDKIKDQMAIKFSEGKFSAGLSEGIKIAGEQLKQNFPYKEGEDINELPDDISFG